VVYCGTESLLVVYRVTKKYSEIIRYYWYLQKNGNVVVSHIPRYTAQDLCYCLVLVLILH